jgi:protein SCO1/2
MPLLPLVIAALVLVVTPTLGADKHDSATAACCAKPEQQKKAAYGRTVASYSVPELSLLDQGNHDVPLSDVLRDDGRPIALNFVFTTCNTICPVMTATFAKLRGELGAQASDMRFVSITIDPEHDTPGVLQRYADRYAAGADWRFLTGTVEDIVAVQKAFDAFAGSKMNHRPLTFLRAPGSSDWVRIDGFASAAELATEMRSLASR